MTESSRALKNPAGRNLVQRLTHTRPCHFLPLYATVMSSSWVEVWFRFMWINARSHQLPHPVSCLSARFGQSPEQIYKMGQNYKQQQFLKVLLKLKRLQNPGDWPSISKVNSSFFGPSDKRELHGAPFFSEDSHRRMEFMVVAVGGVGLCCNTAELTTWVLHWGCLYFTREFQAGQWTILDAKGSRVSYDSGRAEHITERFNVSDTV